MIKKGLLLMLCVIILAGCATTKTFTLNNGQTIRAKRIIEETASTYVVQEEGTGRRTVIPKSSVVSVEGLQQPGRARGGYRY
jgi:uncharacterized lipoprotein YajG